MKLLIVLIAALGLVSCASSAGSDVEKLTVMTFNIRYDNPSDAPNNWDNRKEWVAEMIRFNAPDVVGLQEVLVGQLNDLRALLPGYGVIGRGRDDGREGGEYSAILYDKSKFQLVEENTSWLSATPDVAGSLGWDAACNRVLTKGEFRIMKTGRKFTFYNTHFDHVGKIARSESAKMVKDAVRNSSERMPVIVTGDFNATPDDDVYENLTTDSPLTDALTIAGKSYGPEWTFHDFGRLAADDRPRIDYVFVTSNLAVDSYFNLAEQRGDRFLSDHNPVIVTVEFK